MIYIIIEPMGAMRRIAEEEVFTVYYTGFNYLRYQDSTIEYYVWKNHQWEEIQ